MLDTPAQSNSREAHDDAVIHPLTNIETHWKKGTIVTGN
jgi:hypothetical protein